MDTLVIALFVAVVPASLVLGGLAVVGLLLAAVAAPVQFVTSGPAARTPSPAPSE